MFKEMRRIKQKLSQEKIDEILHKGNSGVLALLDEDNYTYAVPLSYVYTDGKLYFHSAKEGHKLEAIKNHDKVSFCVIEKDEIVPEELTTYFRSVVVFGTARILEDRDEIIRGIRALGEKYSSDFPEKIQSSIMNDFPRFSVIELAIEHYSGKEAIELVEKN